MKKRYRGLIPELAFEIPLDGEQMCTFVTHFGRLGNVEIYDTEKEETVLTTIGTFIDRFYPDMPSRELAYHKSKHLFHYFEDYKYQCMRKYPDGELRIKYIDLFEATESHVLRNTEQN